MELSELHNPSCKLHASQSFEDHSPVRERRHSDVSDIFLSPEAYKATQAVEFIAEHLRNEDEYVQVRELAERSLIYFLSEQRAALEISPDMKIIIGYRRFLRKYKGNNNIFFY